MTARTLIALATFLCGIAIATGAPVTYRASFTETRALSAAGPTLVLDGHVVFQPGRKLVWAIETPYRYHLIIRNGMVEEHLPDGTTRASTLSKKPWAAALFRLFSALFSGNSGALARYFRVTTVPGGLRLVPRSRVLAQSVRDIEVEGRAPPRAVTIRQHGGSTTRLVFQFGSALPHGASDAAAAHRG